MPDVIPAGELDLASLIERIYASVEQPELWPETIGEIGHLIGGATDSGLRILASSSRGRPLRIPRD